MSVHGVHPLARPSFRRPVRPLTNQPASRCTPSRVVGDELDDARGSVQLGAVGVAGGQGHQVQRLLQGKGGYEVIVRRGRTGLAAAAPHWWADVLVPVGALLVLHLGCAMVTLCRVLGAARASRAGVLLRKGPGGEGACCSPSLRLPPAPAAPGTRAPADKWPSCRGSTLWAYIETRRTLYAIDKSPKGIRQLSRLVAQCKARHGACPMITGAQATPACRCLSPGLPASLEPAT